ncbi:MAG: type I glyceraldehyde-3-phosphate dehydrogenase [Clostridia bacterium]|nr:type I glyceraldehyde-3-phosphate dehydrogenase [Clostridia bacterium]
MTIRVGINGFGNIGRRFARQALRDPDVTLVAVNDIGDLPMSAHLFKYDSTFGTYPGQVTVEDGHLVVDGRAIRFFTEAEPDRIPWREADVDVVVEATGRFTDAERARGHLAAGARKVVISAPARGEDLTVVMGVNHDAYRPDRHHVLSNASCTTNALAPIVKVLDEAFGLERGLMTTVHAYTNDQRLLDLPHRDPRRARAAGVNIIPTTTGAARAVGKVLPHLQGRLNGLALRVPTPAVSVVDLVAVVHRSVTVDGVHRALEDAAGGPMRGILAVSRQELVSQDYKGVTASAVVDAPLTMVSGDHLVKVVAWYDNEWGYSARLLDLVKFIAVRGLAGVGVG